MDEDFRYQCSFRQVQEKDGPFMTMDSLSSKALVHKLMFTER